MNEVKLFIASADTYTGLYVNGKLKSWNDTYNFTINNLEDYVTLPAIITEVDGCEVGFDLLEEFGDELPDSLDELKENLMAKKIDLVEVVFEDEHALYANGKYVTSCDDKDRFTIGRIHERLKLKGPIIIKSSKKKTVAYHWFAKVHYEWPEDLKDVVFLR